MHTSEFLKLLKANAEVLLPRVFKGQSVTCFGADGFGKHGRSHYPLQFQIADVSVSDPFEENELLFMDVTMKLDGYSASAHGHVFTDTNLKISINNLLAQWYIKPSVWSWGSLDQQTEDSFTVRFTG